MASQGAEAMSQWNQGGKNQINFGSNKGQQNSVAGVTNMAAMGKQSQIKL